MKRVVALLGLSASLVLSGCASDATARLSNSQVPGTYYSGDGLGRVVYVRLHADGTYSGEWSGCLGTDGRSAGTWTLEGERLRFHPKLDSGLMRGYLDQSTVVRHHGTIGFARAQDVHEERIDAQWLFLRE